MMGSVAKAHALIGEVARQHRFAYGDLHGRSRRKPIVEARQDAMALCWEHTGLSLNEIGRLFDGRDHTTVLDQIEKAKLRHGGEVPVPSMAQEKFCPRCCEVRPATHFWRNNRPEGDGMRPYCRDCTRAVRRAKDGVRMKYRRGMEAKQISAVLDAALVDALRETAREFGELQSEIVSRALRREVARMWEACRACGERRAMVAGAVCGPCFSAETQRKVPA